LKLIIARLGFLGPDVCFGRIVAGKIETNGEQAVFLHYPEWLEKSRRLCVWRGIANRRALVLPGDDRRGSDPSTRQDRKSHLAGGPDVL
jgi:hypothetical protein